MKGMTAAGIILGGMAGAAATAAVVGSMHPGMLNRDFKKVSKKAKQCMHRH